MTDTAQNGFIDRIEQLLAQKNIKKTAFAKIVGVTNQAFSDWKRRGTIPAADIVCRIADALDVDLRWLITGEQANVINISAERQNDISVEDRDILAKLHELSPSNSNAVISLLETLYVQEQSSREKSSAG